MPDGPTQQPPLATAAAICAGIAWGSLLCSVVPFMGCLMMPAGPLGALAAVGLGVSSLTSSKEGRETGGPLWAIVGIAGGGLYLLVLLGGLVWFSRHQGVDFLHDAFREHR